MTQRLFIYGTLAPGQSNHKILEDIPGSWKQGSIRGALLQEGWGASMGCPGIVPSNDGDIVEGFIFTSEQLTKHWQMLDKFEGEEYTRVLVPVRVNGIQDGEAYAYVLNRDA